MNFNQTITEEQKNRSEMFNTFNCLTPESD